MSLLDVLILSIVQGITEFLPISSSAHLILAREVLGISLGPDQELILDLCLHAGTLLAVLYYCRGYLAPIVSGLVPLLTLRLAAVPPLIWQLALATLPVVIAGLAVTVLAGGEWREGRMGTWIIAITTLVFGAGLWLADRLSPCDRTIADLNPIQALAIGLFQALAIIPGVSRAGIVMTAALAFSLTRPEAARWALLTSIPTTLLAGLLGLVELSAVPDAGFVEVAVTGIAASAIAAWVAVVLMVRWLQRQSFLPFVVYRLVLGLALIALLLSDAPQVEP